MFNQIKTSKENKEVVSRLTNKLGLGAENVIARIAIGYSISKKKKLDINNVKEFNQYFLEKGEGGGSRFNEMSKSWTEQGHEITVLAGMVHYNT